MILGILLALLVGMVLLGGIKRIGRVTERLVPFMAMLYIVLALGVILLNFKRIPGVFYSIIYGAFNPSAFTGGVVIIMCNVSFLFFFIFLPDVFFLGCYLPVGKLLAYKLCGLDALLQRLEHNEKCGYEE